MSHLQYNQIHFTNQLQEDSSNLWLMYCIAVKRKSKLFWYNIAFEIIKIVLISIKVRKQLPLAIIC